MADSDLSSALLDYIVELTLFITGYPASARRARRRLNKAFRKLPESTRKQISAEVRKGFDEVVASIPAVGQIKDLDNDQD